RNAITSCEEGIISRGVVLDIPAAQGREWLEPGEAIFPDDLDAAEARQGIRVEEGDILLVRTGRHLRVRRGRPWDGRDYLAVLHALCIHWLHERGVAVLGCDGVSDVMPSVRRECGCRFARS